MNQKSGGDALREICRRGTLQRTLEKYIRDCRAPDGAEETEADKRRRAKRTAGRFPNVAGFCRHHKISMTELAALTEEFPRETALLFAILEDEALNSGLPPPILSAYLKKRLGYDRELETEATPVSVRFEHDIYDDGA